MFEEELQKLLLRFDDIEDVTYTSRVTKKVSRSLSNMASPAPTDQNMDVRMTDKSIAGQIASIKGIVDKSISNG